MKHIVFFLEEESAKAFLDNFLPRAFPDITFQCIPFEGKQDLEKNIPIKLKGYRTPNTKFIILRDEDSGNCIEVKRKLRDLCNASSRTDVLIRIACKELESWYFGDLKSVEMALNIKSLAQYSNNKLYREPDNIINPKTELKKITKKKYNQVSSSREIGKHIDFEKNKSKSFQVFIDGIKKIIEN